MRSSLFYVIFASRYERVRVVENIVNINKEVALERS